ncbi:DinB family protein [Bhargavaea beijingensis]|uniref:DinB family protein n=1 Tax=Bhargavaea beijingensis TaxID=426756 RepID=UPI0022259059|nr:DinB family protein [Bhargavaea beijingensis]MCW1927892.1 DinB family protein [Bhargavaea beijingensis]
MQASEIVWHNEESIRFMQALGTLTDEEWRRPLGPGKWTVAEVAGHFAPWDRFVLEQRLPYFFAEGPLPKGPDADARNGCSARESRGRSRDETIDEFVSVRRQLIGALRDLPAEDWSREFRIGESRMTLVQYFGGMLEHDEHHFRQIRQALAIK